MKRLLCRVCAAPLPAPYLTLGEQPLANALRTPDDTTPEFVAPLAVARCLRCSLSQLTVTVDPAILYHADYTFHSGVSRAWHHHCAAFAVSQGASDTPRTVLDLAANDGTQLIYFKREGWTVLGVDPAHIPPVLVGPTGNECPTDVSIVHGFWPDLAVMAEVTRRINVVDLIVAQNVFGHVDDPVTFLKACRVVLSDTGHIAIEVPHVGDLIANGAFDTIYHEHLSYWSLRPMQDAARRAGLTVERVDVLAVHGGSRRYWLGYGTADESVERERLAEAAMGLSDAECYETFATRVYDCLTETIALLESLEGQRLWAFGASAKGTVMLNALLAHGNTMWPTVIVDETPGKIGKISPGIDIPIVDLPDSLAAADVLWLLSWNWAETLMARAMTLGFAGRFLVTSPDVRLRDCGNSAGIVVE